MIDENVLSSYPSGISEYDAIELFKKEWTRDFHYRTNLGMESVAGCGTNSSSIISIVSELSNIFKEYNIKILLDAPCGDFFIMNKVDLSNIEYIGIDIVKEQIESNIEKFPNINFKNMNMITDILPQSDLVFSRDIFIHLSNYNIKKFIKNCINSGCIYLMSSTYININENVELCGVLGWRLLNLEKSPFNFPKPLKIITEPDGNKSMGIWKFSDINVDI